MRVRVSVVALMLAPAGFAQAQNKVIEAQYWMDLSTSSMSIPGMSDDMMESGMMSQ